MIDEHGALIIEREYPEVGVLRYEEAEAGQWMTQAGTPSKRPRRRYLLGDVAMDSVSEVVDCLANPSLDKYTEFAGPEAMELLREEGATRGTFVHEALHRLATTGEVPNPVDAEDYLRPWLQGAMRAGLALDLGPENLLAAEEIVCNPEWGYAGRFDLYTMVDGKRTLLDFKTSKRGVQVRAHFQVMAYAMCLEACGFAAPERIAIVGIKPDGTFDLVECEATREDVECLAMVNSARRRITAGMAAQRKMAKAVATLAVAA